MVEILENNRRLGQLSKLSIISCTCFLRTGILTVAVSQMVSSRTPKYSWATKFLMPRILNHSTSGNRSFTISEIWLEASPIISKFLSMESCSIQLCLKFSLQIGWNPLTWGVWQRIPTNRLPYSTLISILRKVRPNRTGNTLMRTSTVCLYRCPRRLRPLPSTRISLSW